MELGRNIIDAYVRHAFAQLLGVADRLGEPAINARPLGPTTNSVTSLVMHCCGVAEFWLGHVALGEPSTRDRDAEFSRPASLAELHALVATTVDQVTGYLARLEAGEGIDEGGRQFLATGGTSDASVVLHVLEELYQHLGHAELAADALLEV
ncbi:MAG: DinB family protein [Aquihabitans sp.]